MNFAQWVMETFGIDVTTLSPEQTAKFQGIFDQTMADDGSGTAAGDATAQDDGQQTTATTTARARAAGSGNATRNTNRQVGTDGASTDGSVEENVLRAMRAENARVSRIRAMANGLDTIADQAINEGWTTDRAELAFMRAGRSQHSAASSGGGEDEPQVMEAALLMNTGMPTNRLEAHFNEQILDRASHANYRGFSMVECAERLRARAGIPYSGARNQMAHMTAVAEACNRLRAAGFSSFTLSNILENAADKVLLDMYQAVETTWQQICAVRSLNDFKIHSQYALDPTNTFLLEATCKFALRDQNQGLSDFALGFSAVTSGTAHEMN